MKMATVSFKDETLRIDTSQDAEKLCEKLNDKDVEILILQGNTFGIEGAERLGQELSKQPNLREAHFKDIFTSRGREEVPDALQHLLNGIHTSQAQLTLLDLSDNAIGPIGAPTVVKFLRSRACETLKKLYVNNCGWGPEGSTSLAATIPQLRCLKELVCGRSRLENKGSISMSRALLELNDLEVLRFNQNGIKEEGMIELIKVLEANVHSLKEFDLSDNWLKDESVRAISEVISKATNLEHIILGDDNLENKHLKEICKGISLSPSLPSLKSAVFEGNNLKGQKIVDIIISTFSSCSEQFCLNLLDNEFSSEELKRLESLSNEINIQVDEADDQDYVDEEAVDENGSESSNGYLEIGTIESELREVSQDFINQSNTQPFDNEKMNQAFVQLIRPGHGIGYQAVQIICEELGLIKCEVTRKKKPTARVAIEYLEKRLNDLPSTYKDFMTIVIKNLYV